tara:strand:- start:4480 stop:5706 length:1227 start_codon:yes stop_codon:yes gene_type:complete
VEHKIIYFIVAEESTEKIYKHNSLLIEELSKKFDFIYILNLFNLKLFSKKKKFEHKEKINEKLYILNFFNNNEFKKFASQKKIVAIFIMGKDPSYFNIHYQINKFNIKLVMIMNQSQIGNKMTADINFKYLFSAYKNYFIKGFYSFFRLMTLLNIFPKITLLFESNLEIKKFIENSRSKKIEKYLPFLKLSYFNEVITVNSIYFDKMNFFLKNKAENKKHIIYVDTHFDHPDRLSREGKVDSNKQNIFYKNLGIFLKKISDIYNMPVKISKHPNNQSNHDFYKFFEISKIGTDQEIFDSDIVIYTLSSAVLNAVMLRKKIINVRSELLGDYLGNINRQYVESLGLVSFDIDKKYDLNKYELDLELNKSKLNYDNYINFKLMADGNNSSCKKISEVISSKFFKDKTSYV